MLVESDADLSVGEACGVLGPNDDDGYECIGRSNMGCSVCFVVSLSCLSLSI